MKTHFIQNFNLSKPFRIRFAEIDGFIATHDCIRYLVLFDHVCFDKISDSIECLLSKKVVLEIVLIIIIE